MTKGALYFHFNSKEEPALGMMDVQPDSVPLPPQLTMFQELVDQGRLLAYRLRHETLVRASAGPAMDQAV